MAQQGEDIKFTIQGNDEINLDAAKTIKVVVYLQAKCNVPSAMVIAQLENAYDDDGVEIPNMRIGKIAHSNTLEMEEGVYNMEILIKDANDDISIYTKKNVFTLECSMSKNIANL